MEYQTIDRVEKLLHSYDYAVIPSDGVVGISQDSLGFIHLKVGICRENWRDGEMIRFVNKDLFRNGGGNNGK